MESVTGQTKLYNWMITKEFCPTLGGFLINCHLLRFLTQMDGSAKNITCLKNHIYAINLDCFMLC